jgi:hypothetical protein
MGGHALLSGKLRVCFRFTNRPLARKSQKQPLLECFIAFALNSKADGQSFHTRKKVLPVALSVCNTSGQALKKSIRQSPNHNQQNQDAC